MTIDTSGDAAECRHGQPRWLTRLRAALSTLVFASLLPGWQDAASQAELPQAEAPPFVDKSCVEVGLPYSVHARVRCGTVAVPRIYGRTDSDTYELAVVVVASATQPPSLDPLLILEGGPGSSAIRRIATLPQMRPGARPGPLFFANDRDLILVDPRSAGSSEPAGCGRGIHGSLEVSSPDYSPAEMLVAVRSAMRDCLEAARRRGVLPEHFGTVVSVQDLELVRRALGVDRWNAIGVSAGTVTGLELAGRYPDRLRSLVVDSVVPFDNPSYIDDRFAAAVSTFLRECSASVACNAAYPELASDLESNLAALETTPIAVRLPPQPGESGNLAIVNRADLELIIFSALYNRESIARLPLLIESIGRRRTDEVARALADTDARLGGPSELARLGVLCRDYPLESALLNARPGAPVSGIHSVLPGDVCGGWVASELRPEVPVATKVPILVLGGALDPATSSQEGLDTARRLGPSARFVEFPSVGHVTLSQPCSRSIVAAFLDDPGADLDVSCAELIPPIEFAVE